MPTDYATPPGTSGACTEKQPGAEQPLARIAGKLMAFSQPAMPAMLVARLALLVLAGTGMRALQVPAGWDTAEAVALLAILVLAVPALYQRPGRQEPPWAAAARVHQQSLAGRVDAGFYQQVTAVMSTMTTGTRWKGAYLYVPRCTEENPQRVHYGACCAGGTYPSRGRLLVIIGEHLAYGLPALALAVVAHERRHVTPWRLHLYAVASIADTGGLIVAGWAVPWPALLPVAVAVHAASVLLLWGIEASCDLGAARDAGKDAIIETVRHKQRTKGGSRALWPAPLRVMVGLLTWIAGPEHPPYALRCWLIRRLAR